MVSIHQRILTLDSHLDTLQRIAEDGFDPTLHHRWGEEGSCCLDLPRTAEGGLGCVFLAAYTAQGPLTETGRESAWEKALAMLDHLTALTRQIPNKCGQAVTPAEVRDLHVQGKLAIVACVENTYPIGGDLARVDELWSLGVRYITLCHYGDNWVCGTSAEPEKGLSQFGKHLVAHMNRLGMMVDLSHTSERTCFEVLEYSTVPVVASHSCARALCDHPRNLSDHLLRKIASKGGVVQVCAVPFFLRKNAQAAEVTVSDFVDHIDHIIQVAGVAHVGIGTDFDGGGGLSDCRDVSGLPRITEELLRRGYTEPQLRLIWGENFLRVWQGCIDGAEQPSAHDLKT